MANVEDFLDIARHSGAGGDLDLVVQVHEDVNKLVIFHNCKGPMTPGNPKCELHPKLGVGITRAMCKGSDGRGACRVPWAALVM